MSSDGRSQTKMEVSSPRVRSLDKTLRFPASHITAGKTLSTFNAFPYFIETLFEFGFRTKTNDDLFHHFHWRRSAKSPDMAEISYLFRFFEKNDWGEGEPWSLRQTAVYHRLDLESADGAWILIKPHRQITIHLLGLSFTLQNWRAFLTDNMSILAKIEDKTVYSHAEEAHAGDYKLTFSDRQKIQALRRTLIQASALIQSSLDLSVRIASFWKTIGAEQPSELKEAVCQELEDFVSEMTYNETRVDGLLKRSSETASMLVSILEHRLDSSSLRSAQANEASLKANNKALDASKDALSTLKDIALQGKLEQNIGHESNVNIRALTVVATLYLPASLLAGILSSHLVDSATDGHFVVSVEFWKFIVILVAMVVVTFSLVFGIQKVSKRTYKRKLAKLMESNHV
ncbi:hypothetical protein DL765_001158 [Monosporascus sp. GIB2]|nr:hypothetical protein DL765_001158 [Monosporascus sp. GIB2]